MTAKNARCDNDRRSALRHSSPQNQGVPHPPSMNRANVVGSDGSVQNQTGRVAQASGGCRQNLHSGGGQRNHVAASARLHLHLISYPFR